MPTTNCPQQKGVSPDVTRCVSRLPQKEMKQFSTQMPSLPDEGLQCRRYLLCKLQDQQETLPKPKLASSGDSARKLCRSRANGNRFYTGSLIKPESVAPTSPKQGRSRTANSADFPNNTQERR